MPGGHCSFLPCFGASKPHLFCPCRPIAAEEQCVVAAFFTKPSICGRIWSKSEVGIIDSLISFEGAADVINNLVDKLSSAVGWIATHSTPKREALSTYIAEVQTMDIDPLEKAALISNAKRSIEVIKIGIE